MPLIQINYSNLMGSCSSKKKKTEKLKAGQTNSEVIEALPKEPEKRRHFVEQDNDRIGEYDGS